MTLKVNITGGRALASTALAFRKAAAKDLAAELDKGVHDAIDEVDRQIRADTDRYMPQGFERTFRNALRSKKTMRLTGNGRTMTLEYFATGRNSPREIERMNQGILRHPVYGRYRRLKDGSRMRNPWVDQQIRPGWADEPARKATPKAVKQIDKAAGRLASKLNRGV